MKNRRLDYVMLLGFILVMMTMFTSVNAGDNIVGFSLVFTVVGFLLTNFMLTHYSQPKVVAINQLLKRVLKIFIPHVILLAGVTLIFAVIFAPALLENLIWQLLATLGFATNYWSIAQNLSGNFADSSALFFHMWPLSVAGQYLFFGVLGLALCQKLVGESKKDFKYLVLAFSIIGAAVAVLLMVVQPALKSNPELAYFSSLSYLFSFAVGSGVSCLTKSRKLIFGKHKKLTVGLVATPAVASILLLAIFDNSAVGWWHFLAIVGTSVLTGLLLRTITYENEENHVLISTRINLFFLKIYLLVWPLYLIFAQKFGTLQAKLIALVVSLALALLATFIQKRFVQGLNISAGKINNWSGVAFLALLILGTVSVLTGPVSDNYLAAKSVDSAEKAVKTTSTTSATTTTSSTTTTATTTSTQTSAEIAEKALVAQKDTLFASWKNLMTTTSAQLDIAIYAPTIGQTYQLSNQAIGTTFDTASIVKVSILGALLQKTQTGALTLTQSDQYLATDMITQSSNDAATSLLNNRLGGYAGLQPFFDSLAMTSSTVDTWAWGLTQTTASDQIILLKNIFYPSTLLTDTSRTYMEKLMSEVGSDQDWGVSAGAEQSALKNGWLNSDDGTWTINSIGHVASASNPDGYVMAILSTGNESEQAGIQLVEHFASATTAIMLK